MADERNVANKPASEFNGVSPDGMGGASQGITDTRRRTARTLDKS